MKEFNKQKRQRQIIQELRDQKLTLQEIGKRVGISKQRVHQILSEEYLNESEFTLSERLKNNFEIENISKRGWPDFLVITKDGKICAIEVKKAGNVLSSYQKKSCRYLEAGGIPIFISIDGELNKDIIDFLKNGNVNKKILRVIEGMKGKKTPKKFERERRLVITRSKVLKFFVEKNPNYSIDDIAEAFKIHQTTIRRIIKAPIPLPYNKGTQVEQLYK